MTTHKTTFFKSVSAFLLLISLLISMNYIYASEQLTFPITSEQLTEYYAKNGNAFYLKEAYQAQTKTFTEQELSVPIKDEVSSFKLESDSNLRYFEVGEFKFRDSYTCKLVMYNLKIDGDISALYTQLNSYNEEGELVDAVLLERRFGYEDINFFSKFIIDNERHDDIDIFHYVMFIKSLYDINLNEYIEQNSVPHAYARVRADFTAEGEIEYAHYIDGWAENVPQISLPMDQRQLESLYLKNPYNQKAYLRPHFQAQTKTFTGKEMTFFYEDHHGDISAHQYYVESGEAKSDMRYVNVGSFYLDDYTYELIMYRFIDYDSPGPDTALRVRLNGYDKQGNVIDSLIVFDHLYSPYYKSHVNFSEFSINHDVIEINDYLLNTFDMDALEHEIIVADPIPQLRYKAQYKIDKGTFKQVQSKAFAS